MWRTQLLPMSLIYRTKSPFTWNSRSNVGILLYFYKFNNVMKSVLVISIVAAICTAVAGLLHLSMVPAQSTNSTILFLFGGIAQVF